MRPEPRAMAVAVSGDGDGQAARIVAKGYGELAVQVIEEARRAGVYVHDSPELVGLLMGLDLDQRIPARLYTVIAELLVWVHQLDADADAPPATGAAPE